MEHISSNIKKLRIEEDLTQKEFSQKLLISQSYLSGVENGREQPTERLIKLICLEFGVNEEWLVTSKGEMYDDVYENNKGELATLSNKALLSIMQSLTTSSNVEYGFVTMSISMLADMLKYSESYKEQEKLDYLEYLQNLLMDVERLFQVLHLPTTDEINLNKHKKVIMDDLDKIISIMISIR